MIKVNIGTNVGHTPKVIDENKTIREALTENNISPNMGMVALDGSTVRGDDIDKSFKEFGFDGTPGHDTCYLLSIAKTDNA